MNLLSNTQYRLRLFTQSSSNPSNDFRDISATTYPARNHFFLFLSFFFILSLFLSFFFLKKNKNGTEVTGITIEQVTYNSITFLMKPSSGAISYSAQLFDQSYSFFHFLLLFFFFFFLFFFHLS